MSKIIEEQYLKRLAVQFAEAEGITSIDMNSKTFLNEFNIWLGEIKNMCELYPGFLDSMNVKYDGIDCAEVGKGEYDSAFSDYKTTIISEMPIDVDDDRLVVANFVVMDDKPTLVNKSESIFFHVPISKKKIQTYLTQNPYYPELIEDWERMASENGNDIVLGMYGRLIDKDREKKITMLEKIRDRLTVESKFENDVFDGNYYAALFTKKKTKFLSRFFK